MMHTTPNSTLACLLAAALLAGCAQTPVAPGSKEPASPPAHPRAEAAVHQPRAEAAAHAAAADPGQVALRDGIEAYNNGDYNGAIRKLNAPEIARSSHANRLTAIKYAAFSYCVSGRAGQCRQQFEKAFKLDPAFELEPGETGHPLWGPEFARAKKARVKMAKSRSNGGTLR